MCIWIMPSSIHADGEQWSFTCSSSAPGKARRSANIETRDGCLIGLACHPNVDLHSVLGCLGLQRREQRADPQFGDGRLQLARCALQRPQLVPGLGQPNGGSHRASDTDEMDQRDGCDLSRPWQCLRYSEKLRRSDHGEGYPRFKRCTVPEQAELV